MPEEPRHQVHQVRIMLTSCNISQVAGEGECQHYQRSKGKEAESEGTASLQENTL
ncbi:hypothetical protein LEMLEM_LOCUS13199 [Lemmus lemmus]